MAFTLSNPGFPTLVLHPQTPGLGTGARSHRGGLGRSNCCQKLQAGLHLVFFFFPL